MPRKTVSSTFALAAAGVFALSSAAFAQTMIGDQEVSAEDLAAVTEHCAVLAGEESIAADDAMTTTDGDMASDDSATDDMATGAMTDDAAEGEMMAGNVDLAAITLADCEGAGLTNN